MKPHDPRVHRLPYLRLPCSLLPPSDQSRPTLPTPPQPSTTHRPLTALLPGAIKPRLSPSRSLATRHPPVRCTAPLHPWPPLSPTPLQPSPRSLTHLQPPSIPPAVARSQPLPVSASLSLIHTHAHPLVRTNPSTAGSTTVFAAASPRPLTLSPSLFSEKPNVARPQLTPLPTTLLNAKHWCAWRNPHQQRRVVAAAVTAAQHQPLQCLLCITSPSPSPSQSLQPIPVIRHCSTSVWCTNEVPQDIMKKRIRESVHPKKTLSEIEAGLEPNIPRFRKTITFSCAASANQLPFPAYFCREHLPKEDSEIILIDENMDTFSVKYRANLQRLSSGWRQFSIKHRVAVNDVLIFQLQNSMAFKVYICRARESYAGDATNFKLKSGASYTSQRRQSIPLNQLDSAKDMEQDTNTASSSGSSSESSSDAERNGENVNEETTCSPGERVTNERNLSTQPIGFCFRCFELKQVMKQVIKCKAAETRAATKEAKAALKETMELRYFKSCKVCMEHDMSILLLPCKHLCLCKECGSKLHVCPVCNTVKVSSVEVFMA